MLLSTFELLLKPIATPPEASTIAKSSLLQGYFVTIANPNPVSLQIRLKFHAEIPTENGSGGLAIGNTLEDYNFTKLDATGIYEFSLPDLETAMVILQPNILNYNPDYPAEPIEVRGYVEIFVVRRFPLFGFPNTYPLLVTPEHRGTFLAPPSDSGEGSSLVYSSLPTSNGGSLMNIESIIESGCLESIAAVPGIPGLIPRPITRPHRCAEAS